MRYRVEHLTEYRYGSPAALSYNEACLNLRDHPGQQVHTSAWEVEPEPGFRRGRVDFFGNQWELLSFDQAFTTMRLRTSHEVLVTSRFPQGLPASPELSVLATDAQDLNARSPAVAPFLWNSRFVRRAAAFAAYGRPCFKPGRPFLDGVMELTTKIYRDFEYAPQSTTITTTVEEVLQTKRGVCQDYAHFMLAVLRSLAIPARYVSGYLHTAPARGADPIRGADASHAWVAVRHPNGDWVDFDPTNGLLVADGHITIGWGRDYADVTPLKGVVLGGGTQSLRVEVQVTAIA